MSYWAYCALARLPLPAAYGLAAALSWLTRNVLRYRRRTVAENLARSFPDISAHDREQINRRFYRQLVDTAFEIIASHDIALADLQRRMTIRNPELILDLSAQRSRPVVVLVIHQGNWEWMLHVVSAQLEIPVDPVYKPLHDAGADRFMFESRSRFGAEPVTADSAARNILRKRRSMRLFALLADQSPGPRARSHWTHTLHQPTAWHTGAATIARLTGSPLCFAQCIRTSRGHYEIVFHEITRDPKRLGEAAIIDAYAALAEQAIREQPESYLWSNRRWKLAPPQPAASSAEASGDTSTDRQSNQSKPSP